MSDSIALALMLVVISGFGFSMWIAGAESPATPFSESSLPEGKIKVTKVIDGDTILVEGGKSVRLEGIDADERERPCYKPAKRRLEQRILGKEVTLERTGESKGIYDRFLRYVIFNGTNINLELVRQGMVVSRPSEDRYKKKIIEAEKKAMSEGRGCKWGGKSWLERKESSKESEEKYLDPCKTSQHIGERKEVVGEVKDSYSSESATYLNFGGEYPEHCFTAVIWSDSLHRFPEEPAKHYLGKKVVVEGEIESYNGTPEMVLEEPSEIELKR